MTKKLLAAFCAIALLVMMLPYTVGAVDIVPYESEVIATTQLYLSSSNGKVYADATIKTKATASKLGFSSITLYQKIDGVWMVAASATQKYLNNDSRYDYSVSCTLVSGREYKASCKTYAIVNGQSDTSSASAGPRTF